MLGPLKPPPMPHTSDTDGPTKPTAASHDLTEAPAGSGRLLGRNSLADVPNRRDAPSVVVSGLRAIFGYRKTSLTLLVSVVLVLTYALTLLDASLGATVELPRAASFEGEVLDRAWRDLQQIGRLKHPYGSQGNDYVHNYLLERLSAIIADGSHIELDTDTHSGAANTILYPLAKDTIVYYESNNLVVRINGTDPTLDALLVLAHYDSVPTSYGITDDGMGVALMLGLVEYYSSAKVPRPRRTLIFNFNNDEEFGLYGATAFVLAHRWFKQVGFFLNLEGTGAGGKCILFRSTDYGVAKYYGSVRFPYATSLFQQGFNNRVIHSETDYKVYKEQGSLRGIDLAFYKPRDLYHTDKDKIANVNVKSLWHMLASAIDYTVAMSSRLDLDDESEHTSYNFDPAVFGTFANRYFVWPIRSLIVANLVLLVAVPLVSLPLLVTVLYYKRNWSVGVVNFVKFPLAYALSIAAVQGLTRWCVRVNEFLPTSHHLLVVTTLMAAFALVNYVVLNSYNYVFYNYKKHDHDEKLIIILQVSFLYWVALVVSTAKLFHNKMGDDHTGEYPLTLLLALQSTAGLVGLLGWTLRKSRRNHSYKFVSEAEDRQPLIAGSPAAYGSQDHHSSSSAVEPPSSSSSILLTTQELNQDEDDLHRKRHAYLYAWSIQFLLIVPLSSLLIFHIGALTLDGVSKSIQESLALQKLIYKCLQAFVFAWALPFLAFVFKINRFGVLLIVLLLGQGLLRVYTTDPFDQLNPLKLRFLQLIDLDSQGHNAVDVYGRQRTPMRSVLSDLPSLKAANESLVCTSIGDGMEKCSFNTTLGPNLVPNLHSYNELLQVQILKNSLNGNEPFGLLTGEVKITTAENRMCNVGFYLKDESNDGPIFPVKTIIVHSGARKNATDIEVAGIPKGFSRDAAGNFIYKDLDGLKKIQLLHLNASQPYHIEFQWVPNFFELNDATITRENKLGLHIECFWAEADQVVNKDGTVIDKVPVYSELLQYSPNYVSWANKEQGLVALSKSVLV